MTTIITHLHTTVDIWYLPLGHPLQVLLEVHRLNSTVDKLKQFVDFFLSVVMETNPSLLEGMPSLQHSTGVQPHILAAAGRSEVRGGGGTEGSAVAPLLPTLPDTHISFTFHPLSLQLLLELQSQEQGCHHLQRYSSLLLTRVADRDPSIRDRLTGRGQGQGRDCGSGGVSREGQSAPL